MSLQCVALPHSNAPSPSGYNPGYMPAYGAPPGPPPGGCVNSSFIPRSSVLRVTQLPSTSGAAWFPQPQRASPPSTPAPASSPRWWICASSRTSASFWIRSPASCSRETWLGQPVPVPGGASSGAVWGLPAASYVSPQMPPILV